MPFSTVLAAALTAASQGTPATADRSYHLPETSCYRRGEFRFERRDGTDSIIMAGDISWPKHNSPEKPLILMITGSGDHVRDQMISGVPMFGMIADFLSRAGYPVARVDPRGYGKSTINGKNLAERDWVTVFSDTRYRDAIDLMDRLKGDPRLAGRPIAILGHSEGAQIAARIAADRPDLALAILLSGSAAPGDQVFALQRTQFALRDGLPPAQRDALLAALIEMTAYLTRDIGNDARFERLVKQFEEAQTGLKEPIFPREFLEYHRTRSPWHIRFMAYDPYPDLRRIRIPTLAYFGSADDATDPSLHLPILTRALAEANNVDFQVTVVPDQDHFFLEHNGKRVKTHPYGEVRISTELKTKMLADLDAKYGRSAYCTD